MDKSEKPPFDRRGFLKGAAAGAAAFVAKPTVATAQQIRAAAPVANADEAGAPAPTVESRAIDRPGSDFMVDVLKSLGFDYACANPGASFAGLHESLINYSPNKAPELITCMHEESSVAMAQGFGIHAEGPISDPKDLGPAIARAINVVKRGEPALVDVVTQPR